MQIAGDQDSMSGSLEDNTPSMAGDESPEQGGVQDHMFEGKNLAATHERTCLPFWLSLLIDVCFLFNRF